MNRGSALFSMALLFVSCEASAQKKVPVPKKKPLYVSQEYVTATPAFQRPGFARVKFDRARYIRSAPARVTFVRQGMVPAVFHQPPPRPAAPKLDSFRFKRQKTIEFQYDQQSLESPVFMKPEFVKPKFVPPPKQTE
jgi:hypothetical protein